jgi:multisubunit Na+/H+ antiporter MnhE subunit
MNGLVEVLVWWVVLVLVWLASLTSTSVPELVAAAVCAVPCALAARWARLSAGNAWRPRVRWLAWLRAVPVSVVSDTARVFGVVLRRLRGERVTGDFRTLPVCSDDEGTRAVATVLVSATPGTVVVDAPPGENVLVAHTLVDGPSAVERAVSR